MNRLFRSSKFLKKSVLCGFSLLLIITASSCRKLSIFHSPSVMENVVDSSAVFDRYFMGYMFYDPQKEQIIAAQNEGRYFTPASVTKLFTFYTALQLLGDTIPALNYASSGDTLWFSGTGDPSFLHPDLEDTTAFAFLKNWEGPLYYVPAAYDDQQYGPGWAWDDYSDYYMAEKSPFPLYGNILRFEFQDSIAPVYHLRPKVFSNSIIEDTETYSPRYLKRDLWENVFRYNPLYAPRRERETDVPFMTSDSLTLALLSDTLQREIMVRLPTQPLEFQQLPGMPADTVYKRLLTVSDNFIAEQLLLMCSGLISDTLSSREAIRFSQDVLLNELSDPLIWVDGSGLSRYNMFTPRSMVELLQKIHAQLPEERIFDLLPVGGESGTLKYWYGAEKPYVFAKTGTLRHNHNLCGYLKTKSGKTLIFAIMNNHIPGPSSMAKEEMQKLLRKIYEEY